MFQNNKNPQFDIGIV